MQDNTVCIYWMRRDFRLVDNAALHHAVSHHSNVIPVFIRDELVDALGAAPKFKLGLAVEAFSKTLKNMNSTLVVRSGDALDVLRRLIHDTGATHVVWNRLYDPETVARDTKIKAALKSDGVSVDSFASHLLFEPWVPQTKTGGFYKVYTPFWKNVRTLEVTPPLPRVESITTGPNSVSSEDLSDWDFAKDMHRGAKVVRTYVRVGETAALDRLSQFIEEKIFRYNDLRDFPNLDATSGLSQNLTVGEISPRTCWFAAQRAFEQGQDQAEIFMKELVWREFAYHLMHHTPHITSQNWKPDWDNFPWNTDETHPNVVAWTQGRTGIQFVDAAMRELYVTGTMHNRARMIVASYLTKHLLSHWKIGQKWFEDTLIDWDPASNAMGWQWSAGSGPDATPYFRVFNPVTQLDKFDKNREYVSRWIAEGKASPTVDSRAFFKAIPESWRLSEKQLYPHPKVTAEAGRKIALSAYENKGF